MNEGRPNVILSRLALVKDEEKYIGRKKDVGYRKV